MIAPMVRFAEQTPKQTRPNIILLITDQQASHAMSGAGNADLKTPNLDRLAARGVRFEKWDANHDGLLSREEFLNQGGNVKSLK